MFTLAERAFLSFGGAASVDYQQRTPGFDWFLTEVATDADVERAVSTSKSSHIDVLLTHETVNGGTAATENQLRSNPNGWSAEALYYSRLSRERVTSVWKAIAPKLLLLLLLHGHMHIADEISLADGTRVISVDRDGQEKNLGLLELEMLDWQWITGPGASPALRRSLNVESQYRTRPGDARRGDPL